MDELEWELVEEFFSRMREGFFFPFFNSILACRIYLWRHPRSLRMRRYWKGNRRGGEGIMFFSFVFPFVRVTLVSALISLFRPVPIILEAHI